MSLDIMRSCDGSQLESGRSEIMEGPWRQIMRRRVESMHKLVTGGKAGARGSWYMTETDWELVRAAAGSRRIEPFRPQQKMKSGLQAMESMSGESRGRLLIGRWGVFKENENTLPVWEPTIQILQSSIHGSMQTHRTRQSIVNHAQISGMSQPVAASARTCVRKLDTHTRQSSPPLHSIHMPSLRRRMSMARTGPVWTLARLAMHDPVSVSQTQTSPM